MSARRVFVDARDHHVARLVDEAGHAATVPAAWLPPSAVEGSWLSVTWEKAEADQASEAATAEQRRTLSADDDGGDIKL